MTFRLIYSFRPEGFGSNIGLLNGIRSAFGQEPVAWLSEAPWNNLLLMVIMIWIQGGFAMVVGTGLGRYMGWRSPWAVGLGVALFGATLVAIAIALGG